MADTKDTITTSVLRMIFTLASGKTKTYNLPDPKSGLTKAATNAVMQAMIDNEAILVNNVEATGIKDSYIYETNKIELS